LFSWNSPSDSSIITFTSHANEVSILVFLELALGPPAMSEAWRLLPEVSILVFLELALGPEVRIREAPESQVSILVFLELALGLVYRR